MRDPRLHIDPSTVRYHLKRAQSRREIDDAFSPDMWHAIIAPLVSTVLASDSVLAVSLTPPPSDLQGAFLIGWKMALDQIRGTQSGSTDELAEDSARVILEHVGRQLASDLSSDPERWSMIICQKLPWELAVTFVESLPCVAIEKNAEIAMRYFAGKGVFDLVETWGRLRDRRTVGGEWIQELTRGIKDPWKVVNALEALTDEVHLLPWARLALRMLERGGAVTWGRMFRSSPLPVQAIIICDVATLDFLEMILTHLLTTGGSEIDVTLVVYRLVQLAIQIDQSLAQASRFSAVSTEGTDARDRYQAEFKDWRNSELDDLMTRVAWVLVTEPSLHLVRTILANLFVRRWRDDVDPPPVQQCLRTKMVDRLVTMLAVDAVVINLLADDYQPGSILAACMATLAGHSKDARRGVDGTVEIVLKAYLRWLRSEHSQWSQVLRDDEFAMAWELGGIVALSEKPMDNVRLLEQGVPVRTEGWRTDSPNEIVTTCRARAHVYIVASMAAERLVGWSRRNDAIEVSDRVWEQLHGWVRSLHWSGVTENVSAALIHCWARAPLVFGETADERVLRQIPLFDHLELLINCLANFRTNRSRAKSDPELPNDLRQALRKQCQMLLPLWEQRHTVSGKDRAEMLDHIRLLTGLPDVQESPDLHIR